MFYSAGNLLNKEWYINKKMLGLCISDIIEVYMNQQYIWF